MHLLASARPHSVNRPRVLVAIPTFNRAHWLSEAISSVLAQTYDDFSLVVSDNRSTDATREVVSSFDDERIRYVRRPVHAGLNEHFTRCLRFGSENEYVFVLPDDDVMLPELLSTTVAVLDRYPTAAFVHSAARVIDVDGNVIVADHNMSGVTGDCLERGVDYIRTAMTGGYRVHGSTILFRSAAIAGDGFRDIDYPATDFALHLRLALKGDIAFVAKPLAAYRVHGGTYTARAGAESGSGGYVQGARMIETIRDVKLRFLDEHRSKFEDVDELRRIARRATRRDLVLRADRLTPDRKFRRTARLLLTDVRRDWRLAIEPAAWRLLVANLLGARLREELKALIRRPKVVLGHEGSP